ncbi:GGDEF domain-containing protein [Modestobacter sp. VKM Ac-2986]|uniref:GGDEF domain-containing protein n=1 Tax=Modestobacter sp. VKM Ac-2986 TaxID=3004140 RepID=UPI0022AB5E91|nr:GGDEF domain-containing protein [Modestobacter sp. VKM Ac-2986]MCZ2830764.1 GGDEF domain-containing protein [Modestobacter sp. VKM Ac-2986]
MDKTVAPAVASPRVMANVLSVFYLAGGVAGLLGASGAADGAGRAVLFALAITALLAAAVVGWFGPRWPRDLFHLPVALAAGLISIAVLAAPDGPTAILAAALITLVSVDACYFFQLPLAVTHLAVALTLVTAALFARDDVDPRTALGVDVIVFALAYVARALVLRASGASRDPLTGLHNRLGFDEALDELMTGVARTGGQLSAALLDLDHFKQINDTAGHQAGDRMLCTVADVWRAELPADAVLARHGGDEFSLLLPGVGGDEALVLVRRVSALHPGVGLSCGVAEHRAGETGSQLMRRADRALYAAKDGGRGRAALDEEHEPGRTTSQQPAGS